MAMEELGGNEIEQVKRKKAKLRKKRGIDGVVKARDAADPKVREALAKEANKGLPDKGYYRDELMKMRADRLQPEIERLAKEIVGGVSVGDFAEKLGIDREIVQHFDPNGGFKITNAHPEYVYAWISYDYPRDAKGAAVRRQLTRRGWEVVNEFTCTRECKRTTTATCGHSMPEAPDLRQPDGTRKLGDTILMRCHKTIYVAQAAIALAKRKQEMMKRRQLAVPNRGFKSHVDPRDPVVREAFKRLGVTNEGQSETLLEGTTGGRVSSD